VPLIISTSLIMITRRFCPIPGHFRCRRRVHSLPGRGHDAEGTEAAAADLKPDVSVARPSEPGVDRGLIARALRPGPRGCFSEFRRLARHFEILRRASSDRKWPLSAQKRYSTSSSGRVGSPPPLGHSPQWSSRGQVQPPGGRLLGAVPYPNVPGAHPQHLRERRTCIRPVPHQRL
jgi:hypothetical protein